jgi:hypothetical protein
MPTKCKSTHEEYSGDKTSVTMNHAPVKWKHRKAKRNCKTEAHMSYVASQYAELKWNEIQLLKATSRGNTSLEDSISSKHQ